ncbi:MAG: N-acyl-D-amino-acid deacylase [Mycobacterium sp.]|jgi:N-acyl-D-amino-acid deacylase|nr:N-acyl-D-amino-acid deacylase [Mycobacterium sp.]
MTRCLLRGGLIADGIGSKTQLGDVLVEDGKIIAVGPGVGDGVDAEIIDLAPGSVVCPGFIDAHVHAERQLALDGLLPGALAQGVTTLVVGQDGSSWIGGSADTVSFLSDYFGPVNGPAPSACGCSLEEYSRLITGRLGQNVAVLASQGTIRHGLAGSSDRPLSDAEIKAARLAVERALGEGAVGLSSGLDYIPSRFGGVEEIAAMATPLAEAGRPYVSHLRAYGADVGVGLFELGNVGRIADVPVHASHLWGPPEAIDTALCDIASHGAGVSFDMYPYVRSSTILAMFVLPAEIQNGGISATLRRLNDPDTRSAVLRTDRFSAEHLSNVVLCSLPERLADHAGKTITQAAADAGKPPAEWTLELLVDTALQVGAHLDRPELTEADLRAIVTHSRHCAGSDGIYLGQRPHPRAYGAFARLTTYYIDRCGTTDYQLLVRHLSTNAADAYRLNQRGRLAPGKAADICVLAPPGLIDRSSFQDPCRLADGASLVLVNGAPVWTDGTVLAARPGRIITS